MPLETAEDSSQNLFPSSKIPAYKPQTLLDREGFSHSGDDQA